MTPFTPHHRLAPGEGVSPHRRIVSGSLLPALMGCRRGESNRDGIPGTVSWMKHGRDRQGCALVDSGSRAEQSYHPASSLRSVFSGSWQHQPVTEGFCRVKQDTINLHLLFLHCENFLKSICGHRRLPGPLLSSETCSEVKLALNHLTLIRRLSGFVQCIN